MNYYGAAYYPEQETNEQILKDIDIMKDAGFNVVRMGEFAWCKFEPREGEYDFSWFDFAIEHLGKNGIFSIVCTPTACPPIWMVEKHPDILYKDNRGVVRPFGGRRHYCYTNAIYREYCSKMAAELGKRYGSNAYVLGFQIDNELAQEGTGRCCCDACTKKFQSWLKAKYITIENFNEKAGTIFWGQSYSRFDQIRPPVRSIENDSWQPIPRYFDNPTLRLDWERFSSDSQIEFQNIQVDQLRKYSKLPVTTNSTGSWTNGINYHKGFKTLDIAAGDVYPSVRVDNLTSTTADYAFLRGLKGQKKIWVLETTSGGGHGVWAEQGILQPFPGALYQNAIQSAVCGADLVTYFQFRMFRFGAEQLEASVMNIDGIPDRRFKEFQQVSRDLQTINPVLDSTEMKNEIAICFDYDSYWSLKIKPINTDYSYHSQLWSITGSLQSIGAGYDIIPCNEMIYNYRMVILLTPVIMDEATKELLKNFVGNGGTLVSNFLTALRNEYHNAPRESMPAGLTDLFGIRVTEGEPVFDNQNQSTVSKILMNLGNGKETTGRNKFWTESLENKGADILGTYVDSFRKCEAVVARNDFGKGTAWYLGTWFDDATLKQLFETIVDEAAVDRVPFKLDSCMEAFTFKNETRTVYFVLNYRQAESILELDKQYDELLTKKKLQGRVTVKAKDVLVLE